MQPQGMQVLFFKKESPEYASYAEGVHKGFTSYPQFMLHFFVPIGDFLENRKNILFFF